MIHLQLRQSIAADPDNPLQPAEDSAGEKKLASEDQPGAAALPDVQVTKRMPITSVAMKRVRTGPQSTQISLPL